MASPSEVQPGVIVRVRCAGGGITFASRRLDQSAADALAARFERELQRVDDSAFVVFDSIQGAVKIRADRVSAIEVSGVTPRYESGIEYIPSGLETR